jgi:hypothetical protein
MQREEWLLLSLVSLLLLLLPLSLILEVGGHTRKW